jgi:hypothetical protein
MGLIAIDPGVHSMAIAVFNGDVLVDAWNQDRAPLDYDAKTVSEVVEGWGSPSVRLINRIQGHTLPGSQIVGERQVVYPGAKGLRTNPNDLLDLAMCSGAFYGALCVDMHASLRLVEPAEWKAQVPKDICRRRIEAMLTEAEKACIKKGGEMHNVYDAIGIGLFGLGRAEKGMVKP